MALAMKWSIGLILVMALIVAEAQGMSRFLAEMKKPKAVKCKKNPDVCVKDPNSAGPYCCKNKCVNVLTDSRNCGRCKYKCKYSTTCCNGFCSTLAYDVLNCGKCGNKCPAGARCDYGICSYA